MTIFKRAILFGISLLLLIVTFPYLLFKDLFIQINEGLIIFNFMFGLILAIYNFSIIYKKATTVHVIIDSESVWEKMQAKKGEESYV